MSPAPQAAASDSSGHTIETAIPAYSTGILQIWKQRGSIRTRQDGRIGGAEEIDGPNTVYDRLRQDIKIEHLDS